MNGTAGISDACPGIWARLANEFDTVVHDDHALAFNHTVKRLIMFGELGGSHAVQVREASGGRPVDSTALPPRYQCSPLSRNEELEGLVLHGGEIYHGGRQWDTAWVQYVAGGRT